MSNRANFDLAVLPHTAGRKHPIDVMSGYQKEVAMEGTIGLPWSALAVGFVFGLQTGVALTLGIVWLRVRKGR